MTTLVYCKDVIAADSLQYINAGHNALPLRSPKVFISPDKTFGYGMVGAYFTQKERERLEKWIVEQILNKLNGRPLKVFKKTSNDHGIIVISRENTFLLNHYDGKLSVAWLDGVDYYVGGTGGNLATTSILMGKGAVEAVQDAIRYDTASGCDIYAVKRSVLKPKGLF